MRRAAPVCALALALSLHAARAAADPQRDADRFFEEGKQLFERGNFAAACSRFEASLAVQSGIGARLWLADCYDNLGRPASAQRQFRLAAEEARKSGDKREQVAQRRADGLESRVVKIVVSLERPAPSERVDVDGAEWGGPAEPVRVDPGRHLVTATAPERVSWQLTFDATNADHAFNVLVPELAPLTPKPPPPSPPPAPSAPAPERPSATRTVGAVTAGVGALSLAAGSVLAILAMRDNSSSKDGCAATCTPEAHDQRVRAIHEANAATVTFVAGGLALAAGALLYLLAPRASLRF